MRKFGLSYQEFTTDLYTESLVGYYPMSDFLVDYA